MPPGLWLDTEDPNKSSANFWELYEGCHETKQSRTTYPETKAKESRSWVSQNDTCVHIFMYAAINMIIYGYINIYIQIRIYTYM